MLQNLVPTLQVEPKASWVSMTYHRTAWVRQRYGRTVLPPNEQQSNLRLTDVDVMRKRTEKIGTMSDALPIRGGDGGNQDMPRPYPA